jgi:type III pantothenate kinase
LATGKFAAAPNRSDDDGALLVRTEHGHLERIIGGDVTLENEKADFFDIGNTHTHVGLAEHAGACCGKSTFPRANGSGGGRPPVGKKFVGAKKIDGAALCSVVPRATPLVRKTVRQRWKLETLELTPKTLRGVGIDYPKPDSIGPDRLANAVAARKRFGAPVVVVDFGTAVTFDVVNRAGNYAAASLRRDWRR